MGRGKTRDNPFLAEARGKTPAEQRWDIDLQTESGENQSREMFAGSQLFVLTWDFEGQVNIQHSMRRGREKCAKKMSRVKTIG